MEHRNDIDTNTLAAEVERYLAAVEVYRLEGCEPSWHPEPLPVAGLMLPHVLRNREGADRDARVH